MRIRSIFPAKTSEILDGGGVSRNDPYLDYTYRYFRAWLPVYDWFGLLIFPIYQLFDRVIGATPGMTVLDLCTGTGAVALRCAMRGACVTGVDVTPAMLEKAKRRTKHVAIDLVRMDARLLAFEDASFDTVVLALGLHDMPRKVRLQVVEEAVRVARRRLVILDYDLPRQPKVRKLIVSLLMLFETSYLKRFAEDGVGAVLEQAHLERFRVIHPRFSLFSVYVVELTRTRDASWEQPGLLPDGE